MKFTQHLTVILIFSSILLSPSCKKDPDNLDPNKPSYDVGTTYTLENVKYGPNAIQDMDLYLPANRNANSTKTFVLIHGGGWNGGDKEGFDYFFNTLKTYYPNHAIINLNYRLGTWNSPAMPKQMEDIESALSHATSSTFNISKQFMVIGSSAGGHLGLLYSYKYDNNKHVKGIINIVGPTDLTDSMYVNNPAVSNTIFYDVFGPTNYASNPQLYADYSPAKFVNAQSAPTISFYGDSDPLIPNSQMPTLHNELNAKGVYNEATMYAGEGHGNWNNTNSQDFTNKALLFINTYFN